MNTNHFHNEAFVLFEFSAFLSSFWQSLDLFQSNQELKIKWMNIKLKTKTNHFHDAACVLALVHRRRHQLSSCVPFFFFGCSQQKKIIIFNFYLIHKIINTKSKKSHRNENIFDSIFVFFFFFWFWCSKILILCVYSRSIKFK